MELDELASQFGGKRVQMNSSDDLAAQFGGKKVIQPTLDDDLAAQFGGKKITAESAGFSAKDTAIALGQGVIGAGKSLTDVFGAENAASQALGSASKTLSEQYTPERKAEMERRQVLQEKASKGSLTDEISTFLGGVAEAPVQSLAQGLGSVVPYIGTGVIGAVAKLGGATITALNTVLGIAQGAGAVKGSLYDGVKRELEKSGMKSEEAAAKASKAQEYLGENFLDIAGGAALGGVGARYGVENLLQKGAAEKLSSKLIPRVVTAAAAEAPLEGAQGGQEQLAVNRALQKQGFDVGTFEGVAGSAVRDAAIGALTAGVVGGVRVPSSTVAPTKEATELDTLAGDLKAKYNLTDEQAVKAATESLRQKQIVADTGATPPPTEVTPPTEATSKQFLDLVTKYQQQCFTA
jgi:hypothetical protein